MTKKTRLLEYLKEEAKLDFDIDNNNCVQFTNKCWEIYHGHMWGEKFIPMKCLEETEHNDLIKTLDIELQRCEPEDGCLVALECKQDNYFRGYILGFCIGHMSVFLSNKGVRYIPTKLIKLGWKNNE